MLGLRVVIHCHVCYALRYVLRICHCLIRPGEDGEELCVERSAVHLVVSRAKGREKKGGFQRETEKEES